MQKKHLSEKHKRTRIVDLRQLNYFVAVAEARHLGRAAKRLTLSQPPLSRQIRQLEAELKVQLFKRTPHGMELTPAGETLLRDARGIHSLVTQAAERARRTGRGQAGRLDIGVNDSAVFGVVPQVLMAFRAAHPDVEVVLHHAQAFEQLQALRHGRLHLIFERELPQETDIDVELAAREPLLLALAERHPLAAQERIDMATLRDETILIGSSASLAAIALQLCRAHGFEPRLASPVSDMTMATVLAAAGAGVTLVPASMTNVHFPAVAYRPLHTRVAAFAEVYCYYSRSESSKLLAAMLETVRSFRKAQSLE